MTGGNVERVNPHKLMDVFAQSSRNQVIATNVEAQVKIHKGLRFRNELDEDLSTDKTILTRKFGNVTKESVFTFEYGLKSIKELLQFEDINMAEIKKFTFQTQISFNKLDGSKWLRVITSQLEVCNEREEVQKKADYEILSFNCMTRASNIARTGDLTKAQSIMKGFKRGMRKNISTQEH